jgi:hypothetical protein
MKFGNDYSSSNDQPREVPAAKTYPARLVGIYDIGKQKGFEPTDPPKNQIVMVYELLGKERMEDGKTFQVSEFLTVSLHAKATLPKRLKVFGAPIKKQNDDWYSLAEDYSLSECVGEACMLEVQHNSKGNAKVGNVIEPIEGMTVPVATIDPGWLDLDCEDAEAQLAEAPKWIQKRVADRVR